MSFVELARAPLFASLCAIAVVACKAESPSVYCVFESEALLGGRCLTECESRCNLEVAAGCGAGSCVDDCQATTASSSGACLDASYAYWRCLRLSGQPRVTCTGTVPSFSVDPAACIDERSAMHARCPPQDAGTDAPQTDAARTDAARAHPDAAP